MQINKAIFESDYSEPVANTIGAGRVAQFYENYVGDRVARKVGIEKAVERLKIKLGPQQSTQLFGGSRVWIWTLTKEVGQTALNILVSKRGISLEWDLRGDKQHLPGLIDELEGMLGISKVEAGVGIRQPKSISKSVGKSVR